MFHKFHAGRALVAAVVLAAAGCHGGSSAIPAAPFAPNVTSADLQPDAASPIKLSVKSLAFANVGASNAKKIVATEKNYKGKFKVKSTCGAAATITPATAKGPKATFKVTPVGAIASCVLTVTDANKHKATAKISISVPPALNVNPASLSYDAVGAPYASTFAVTQSGTGAFKESDTCSGIVTVAAGAWSAPSTTATVTPVAAGTCTITITDAFAQQKQVAVTVTTSGIIIQ